MYFLGIDTSNYTTSVALVDENNNVIEDNRTYLKVEDRATGLRQSEALFQHWNNLPVLCEPVLRKYSDSIALVSASTRPRPQDGSYMPVFNAGAAAGKMIAASLGVDFIEGTHQEGHFKAGSLGTDADFREGILCAHLSGGTLELVFIRDGQYELVGGTRDISYGKLLDRTGVALGFSFPAGAKLDELATGFEPSGRKNPFCRIHTEDTFTNISGLETQVAKAVGTMPDEEIAYYVMDRLAESFVKIAEEGMRITGAERTLVTGGIAASSFLRKYCSNKGFVFGNPRLCSDNAVGVAALKGKKLWDSNL